MLTSKNKRSYDAMQAVMLYNECVERFRAIDQIVMTEWQRKGNFAHEVNDSDALDEMLFIYTTFTQAKTETAILINNFHDSYSKGNKKNCLARACEIREHVDEMEEYMNSMKQIHPKRQEEKEGTARTYFHECNSRETLDKRFRALSKAFHPDSGCGSSELFEKMQEENKEAKKNYEKA